jgi:hypothetical protein
MNNKQVAVLILSAFTLGGFIGATYTKDPHAVQIHKTGSGMFIIDSSPKGERIYQVLELPTNVPSFVVPRGDF